MEKVSRKSRITKEELYNKERLILIKEIEKKVGLTDEKRGILIYDLERNEELKEYLKSKIEEIRKLYRCGTWNYFVRQHTKEGEEPSIICLLKSILKSEGYELITKRVIAERENKKKQYHMIYFIKGLNIKM